MRTLPPLRLNFGILFFVCVRTSFLWVLQILLTGVSAYFRHNLRQLTHG